MGQTPPTDPNRPRRATVKDVARHARVSVGTASQALNWPNSVSEAARRAVLAAAADLDYQPNPLARSLVARRRQAVTSSRGDVSRLVVVGYASIDFVVAVDPYPEAGQRVTSRFIERMLGGPAANVAAFAAGLGDPLAVRVEIVTRIGTDPDSAWALEELARRGVDAGGAQAMPGERLSRCVVMVDATGGRTIVNEPLQVPLDLVTRHLVDPVVPGRRSCIHFDGFHLSAAERAGASLRAQGHLLSLHSAGLDPAGLTAARVAGWLDLFDLLFLDRAAMAGVAASDSDGGLGLHPERLFDRAAPTRCRAVVLTRGRDGATLLRPGTPPVAVPAPAVEVVDATGAGDAFAGVFLGSYLAQGDLVAALGHAVAGASLSVTAHGAQGRLARAADLAPVPAPEAAGTA